MADDVKRLLDEVRRQGWRVEQSRRGAWLCYAPDGITIVTIHATPSDKRWMKNAISELRKGGFRWEGR